MLDFSLSNLFGFNGSCVLVSETEVSLERKDKKLKDENLSLLEVLTMEISSRIIPKS